MLMSNVGLEAEFLLLNAKDTVIVPPATWDRDGFPLLGEVRGDPKETTPAVVASFMEKLMEAEAKVHKGNKLVMMDIKRVSLVIYKEAMKQVTEAKGEQVGKVKSIYNTNIEDFSDQIVTNGKIQGVNSSCGLHIHFSCNEVVTKVIKESDYTYTPVTIPIQLAEVSGEKAILTELIKPEIFLYSRQDKPEKEKKKKKEIVATASVLTRPVIEYIVKEMDNVFFKKFAPKEEDRTKYRQPGFYELKPYGFEYRSLPANAATMEALPEIVSKAFELLNSLNNWD